MQLSFCNKSFAQELFSIVCDYVAISAVVSQLHGHVVSPYYLYWKYRSCRGSAVSNGIPGESEDCPFRWWIWLTGVIIPMCCYNRLTLSVIELTDICGLICLNHLYIVTIIISKNKSLAYKADYVAVARRLLTKLSGRHRYLRDNCWDCDSKLLCVRGITCCV